MSKVVHILKFYNENQLFIERNRLRKETTCCLLLAMGTKNKEISAKIVNEYNEKKGILPGPEFYRGLTVPRLRILTALIAQKEGLNILPSLCHKLVVHNAPARFRTKFRGLMTEGFWMVGVVIEDSLSGDPTINFGNPFGFENGDLAFWWAGVVVMDWLKYCNIVSKLRISPLALKIRDHKKYPNCMDFYLDSCISRKYKYFQDSALSSLKKIPQQFLSGNDFENFEKTISNVSIKRAEVDIILDSVMDKIKLLDI